VGGSHINLPLAEMAAQLLKRAGKWMWRPERVVRMAGSGGVAGGATVGVASTGGQKLFVPAVGPTEHVGWLDPVG
jgi:hypothetical protein